MIKVNKGTVEINGSNGGIKADLCCVMRASRNLFSKEELLEMLDIACLSDEEIEEKHKEAKEKIEKRIDESIEKLLKDLFGETMEKADEEKEE